MIIGHERQIKYLDRILARGCLAHAYLFYGPEQVGKETVAKTLVKAIFCAHAKKSLERVCDSCEQCNLVEKETHPNVTNISRAATLTSKKEKRSNIPIGDIRELKRIFSLKGAETQMRVVLMNEADQMSDEAANAFLKLLEEPSRDTLFILCAASKDLLLPTILSRTQAIGFAPVSSHILRQFLASKKIGQELAETMLDIASGRPGILMRLLSDEKYLDEEKEFLKKISEIIEKKDLPEAFRLTEKSAADEYLMIKTIESIVHLLRAKMLFNSFEQNTQAIAQKLKKVAAISASLETTNVNPRLALDALFLEAMRSG